MESITEKLDDNEQITKKKMAITNTFQKRFYRDREITSECDLKRYWPNAWPKSESTIRCFENEIFTGVKYFNQMLKLKQERSWQKEDQEDAK